MINTYIEQAIQGIEAEREQQIAEAKARAMYDVTSQNAEIDSARDKAVEELQSKLNQDISALQDAFAKQRQEIIEASEKQKEDNTNTRISIETASITVKYNGKLNELRKLIEA